MLLLTRGPGCSVLSVRGPEEFTYNSYNSSIPLLHLNPYTWMQAASIIYVDAPIGTGFRTCRQQETYQFLLKWSVKHPQYVTNILYIGGDSYSGIPLTMIVQKVFDGNANRLRPYLNIQGYVLGNRKTDDYVDDNSQVPFAYQVTLISKELYEDIVEACGGDFVNVNTSNEACKIDLDAIDQVHGNAPLSLS
ncbi:hypothetical protein MLD38_014893 [Melastoma candidum]|uniref:Uncharacterized protein n=1 Tax=Melastoma candidum TaxID=119954 RepID=A0ACB9RFG8_9MYRT|nr:hypothetical protein MLD38_014893 [Melastoma candidum]